MDFASVDQIDRCRPFDVLAIGGHLGHALGYFDASFAEGVGRAGCGDDVETERHELFRCDDAHFLVAICQRHEDGSRLGKRATSSHLALGECKAGRGVDAHHFARRAHLRPEERVGIGESVEWQHRFLHRHMAGDRRLQKAFGPQLFERGAEHDAGCDLCERDARSLRYERHGARGTRVCFDDVHVVVLHGELHVDQADDLEFGSDLRCVLFERLDDCRWKVWWRNDAC